MSQSTALRLADPTDDEVRDGLLSVGQHIVDAAMQNGIDAAEAFLVSGAGSSYGIEKGAVGFTSASGESGIGLRIIEKERIGFAYFTDPADTHDAIASARSVAARTKPGPVLFAEPADTPRVADLFDSRLLELDTDDALATIRAIIDAGQEVHPDARVAGGSIGHEVHASALVNSNGVALAERGTGIGLSAYVVLRSGDKVATGWKSHQSNTLDERSQDPAHIGREAAELARDGIDARPYDEKGPANIVFHPHAIASLLEFITIPAFYGDKVARGESPLTGKMGDLVMDERIQLVDDPTRPGGLGSSSFDDEGIPSRPIPLVEKGRVKTFLYDLASAVEFGGGPAAATSSAVRSGRMSDDQSFKDPPGVSARNVHITATSAKKLDDLIAEVGTGLYVHDLLGAHTANPTSGDFSVSSSVLFAIKDGQLGHAVRPVMLAGNLPQLLADQFLGCSTETETTGGHFSPIGLEVPSLGLGNVFAVGS